MISNNDTIKTTGSNNYVCEWYLSRNVLHNRYFIERNIPLEYFFRWRYGADFTEDIPFIANKSFIDNFLRGRYD